MLVTLILSMASLAVAVPESTLRPWKAPGPEDSRGPCPMVNTLANHGYLPHSGRNLTMHHFAEAVVAALNVDEGFGAKPAGVFMKAVNKEYFDLEELVTPGILQHIASLTREDSTPEANFPKISHPRLQALLADSASDRLDIASLAKSRMRVEALSDPDNLNIKEELISYIEASLVIMMMMDHPVPPALTFPSTKVFFAPKERVRTWLSEERLPDELGWKRSERHILVRDVAPVVKGIYDKKREKLGGPSFWRWVLSVISYWRSSAAAAAAPMQEL